MTLPSIKIIHEIIKKISPQSLATTHYPSRGQTTTQLLYKTDKYKIKLFLKRVSKTNHLDCRINIADGTLAEREFWSFRLAKHLGLNVPDLVLIDSMTTVQEWLNHPDAWTYTSNQGSLKFSGQDIFNCALFDWLSGQQDRHNGNYLYNYADKKIILVDSAWGFLKHTAGLPHYLEIYEATGKTNLEHKFNTTVLKKICTLSDKKLFFLVPLKKPEERSSLLQRKKQLYTVNSIADIIKLFRGS